MTRAKVVPSLRGLIAWWLVDLAGRIYPRLHQEMAEDVVAMLRD